jgi:hypothetical protein
MRLKDGFRVTEHLVFNLYHALEPTAESLWRRINGNDDLDYCEVRIWKEPISDIPQVSVQF